MTPSDIAIDVGDAQPHIDWTAAAASGVALAMIKATEGTSFVSPTFAAQASGAAAVGIRVVPYHFLRPSPAAPQAANFLKATALARGSPFALDWEGRAASTASPETAEQIGELLTAIAGRLPLGYWGIPGSTPSAPTADMLTWDRWVPRYPRLGAKQWMDLPASIRNSVATRWPGALFAQYTRWGAVPGIAGPVDRSVFFGTADELIAWHETGKLPVTT